MEKINKILTLVDEENYVLDGFLLKIEETKRGAFGFSKLDRQSVFTAVENYKNNFISSNNAFGVIHTNIPVNTQDEIAYENLHKQLSVDDLMIPQDFDEIKMNPQDYAFTLLDIFYDVETSCIFGRIFVLDTYKGREVKERLKNGQRPYISSLGIDDTFEKDRESASLSYKYKINAIKGGWKMSFLGRGGEYGF